MVRLLSPVDAVFMTVEKPTNPMHIAGLHLFEPAPGATAADLAAMFRPETRAGSSAPSFFRRRAVRSWTTAGQWAWDVVPEIVTADHVLTHELPAPGQVRQLLELCSRLHSEPLDRARPLWQAHLITGLADGRFALYFKIHHALGDGVRAQRLLRDALSSDSSRTGVLPPWSARPTAKRSEPRPDSGETDWPTIAKAVAVEAAGFAGALGRTLVRTGQAEGAPLSFAAPRSIVNPASISGERRFAAQSWPLTRIRAVRAAAKVSVNDVVLAMCAGALRRYLSELDALPNAPLIAMVPVALRDAGLLGEGENAVGAVMCTLATDESDPARRLARIHQGMVAGKAALSTMSTTQILAMTAVGMSPLVLEPVLGRLAGTRPPFNLIISNVPGPRSPLYFNGARLQGIYPLSIPVDGQALNITCTSYVDQMSFGLTGCARTVAHLQHLLGHLDAELAALEQSLGLS